MLRGTLVQDDEYIVKFCMRTLVQDVDEYIC